MTNGESLFSYKARTTKTSSPKSQPHNRAKTPTPKSPAKPHNRAKTPTPLNKSQKWLKDNPPNRTGIVDELKSMVDPKNLTGANAIQAAIKGDGMSTTKRITTGLSGVVQGLGFAAGSGQPKPKTVLIHGGPAKLEGGVINPAKTATSPKYQHQGTTTSKLNDMNLSAIESRAIPQAQKNLAALQKDIKTPGTFSNLNKGKTRAQISANKTEIARQQKFLKEAKKNNYFTAVSKADEAYSHVGATHIITPKSSQVNTSGLFPGEYQVVGTHKPVKTFPAGKTVKETAAINKQINDYAARLRAPKQTVAPIVAAIQPKSKKNTKVPKKK